MTMLRIILFLLIFTQAAVHANQADLDALLQPKTDTPALECSDIGQPVFDADQAALKERLTAELANREQWFVVGDKVKLPTCLADRKTAKNWLAQPDAVLIDVRPAPLFRDAAVPEALNIPANLVKTKSFLKAKPLLLSNLGGDYASLERLCLDLQEAGFSKVRAMYGGVVGWRNEGEALSGRLSHLSALDAVSADVFYSNKAFRHWLVVDISTKPSLGKALTSLPLGWLFYKDQAAQQAWLGKLQALVAEKAKRLGESPMVLLIDEDGERSQEFLQFLFQHAGSRGKAATEPPNSKPAKSAVNGVKPPLAMFGLGNTMLFRLDGGIAAYESLLKKRLQALTYSPVLNKNRGCGVRR